MIRETINSPDIDPDDLWSEKKQKDRTYNSNLKDQLEKNKPKQKIDKEIQGGIDRLNEIARKKIDESKNNQIDLLH